MTPGTGVAAAADTVRGRRGLPNGILGMLTLIGTEAALLGTLLATYFYLELRSVRWPPPGIDTGSMTIPILLTVVLVLTTVPMAGAAVAARLGRRAIGWWLVAAATVVQAGYLAWQLVLYTDALDKFSPGATAFGSIYFTLLGAHHAHVAVGLLLNLWVLVRLAYGLTRYRVLTVQCVALYWAFVNAFAILVTLAELTAS
jgi:cytochrome c oxidase subunit 3/cytochrome c oxidase subunit I+III